MADEKVEGKTGEGAAATAPVTPPAHTTSSIEKAASAPPSAAATGEGSPAPASDARAATGAGGETSTSPSADPPEGKTPPSRDWKDDRIAKLTAQLKAEREKKAAEGTKPQGPTPDNPEFQAAVERQARELAATQKFNEECDATLVAGRAEFGEKAFNERVQGLFQLVDVNDRQSIAAYQMFLTAALKTGDAKQVIFDLGADLNEAQRILGLSPIDMAVELTKRVAKKGTTQGVSEGTNAPRPLAATVGTHGKSTAQIDPSDKEKANLLPSAEWHSRRSEQRKAAAEQRGAARFR